MDLPLISIILPVYNGEFFLNEAIASCLDQTYSNIELIIVNDASTDASFNIAIKWALNDSRIQIITNEKNLKLPASLNMGHRKANGKYVTWTSHDNIYNKCAIECLFNALIKYDCDVIYSEYLHINEEGTLTGQSHLKEIEYLFFYGVIGACFLYKIEVFNQNAGYDEDLFMVEDYDFWLRALKHSRFKKIDNPGIYSYRYHSASLTNARLMNDTKKKLFYQNLEKTYKTFFIKVSENELLLQYFLGENRNSPDVKTLPLEISFFKKLSLITDECQDINFIKLKRIIVNDLIDFILHERKFQNLKVFYQLHKIGFRELLRLPIERYLALIKKSLF
ncbi:glycosyltransferase family 2 protein [Autumnicola psychrophila]|uniref:Glycosyltransferase n=1 Tax=Autumnicola psychrophila TaxID=3075592 RepID=A0ABU3DT20_9FLAO|nr:glycosyltransferase [Zunongwangia sp. F225]MDT0686857.1 glycosyltransferase [Zunongwangia sp. F225]